MKIAIVGYGLEGKASYKYWNTPDNSITIVDERLEFEGLPANVSTLFGAGALAQLGDFDLIIRSPSVHPDKLPYGDKVWSTTNEFFAHCPAPIIGITGTKGKGTTSSLIASILRAAGKTVHLVGNIGTPALTELPKITPDDIVVFELSSFQLWDIRKSPHVAVVLGIEPDHLDVHHDMQEYVAAKANITRFQTAEDKLVYNQNNSYSTEISLHTDAQKVAYPIDMSDFADALVIPGAHNVENASAAIVAVSEYVNDQDVIRSELSAFEGLPHRLKFVRELNGVKFYDDSIATTPGSAIAAIKSFEQPKVLIVGGSDKGADYTEFVELCERTGTTVVAIGQVGQVIKELCAQIGATCEYGGATMTEIVATANEIAQPGGIVILSPAAASFDMFKSYADRGDQFIAAVNNLPLQ